MRKGRASPHIGRQSRSVLRIFSQFQEDLLAPSGLTLDFGRAIAADDSGSQLRS